MNMIINATRTVVCIYIYIACFRNMIIQGHIVTHVYHRHFHQELLNL